VRFIKPSKRWFAPVYIGLFAIAYGAAFEGGRLSYAPPAPKVVAVSRPFISAKATLAQVDANFSGKPYWHGAISELPGFLCKGWTNGANGSGWVVLVCSK